MQERHIGDSGYTVLPQIRGTLRRTCRRAMRVLLLSSLLFQHLLRHRLSMLSILGAVCLDH